MRDTSNQKRTEAALWEQAERLKSIIDLKERRTAMDMISAQTFRYSISDAGCP